MECIDYFSDANCFKQNMYVEIFSSDILNLLIELFSSFLRIFYSSREISDRSNTKISKLFLYKLFS